MHIWVQVEKNLAHKLFVVSLLVNMCRNYTCPEAFSSQAICTSSNDAIAGFRTSVPALVLQATSVKGMSRCSSWVYSMPFRSQAHYASSVHPKTRFIVVTTLLGSVLLHLTVAWIWKTQTPEDMLKTFTTCP